MPVVNGLTRRWRIPAEEATDRDGLHHLPEAGQGPEIGGVGLATRTVGVGRSTIASRILAARGMSDPDAVRAFCDPRLSHLHDPGLLSGIDAAAARLALALRRRERIAIYGDYDVDGITASAILFHTLRTADPQAVVRCYVPHRVDEGYGLHVEALTLLAQEGATAVVTVDCGITAVEPARLARQLGMDLIVTDHHQPRADGVLPDAHAVVHPMLRGDGGQAYPFPDLCGAGVAFKLAWRLATHWCGGERVSEAFRTTLMEMLPLVALGTIADVVPLRGENRVLASAGLRAIRSSPLAGLQALIQESGLAGEGIDCEKVGFVLAPRLNACGRLGHAAAALRLFTDAGPDEAEAIAAELTALNRQRQRTEQAIAAEACAMAVAQGQTAEGHRAIVLAHEAWHPGVIGIVCSRLVERFGRPTILLAADGEICRGSGRSVEGYSLHDGLAACAGWLEHFGGHDAAAGLAVKRENFDAFRMAFVQHVNDRLAPTDLVPLLDIDCEAVLAEMDHAAVGELARLSPFGRGNRRPTILVRDLVVASQPRVLKERHLKLGLAAADSCNGSAPGGGRWSRSPRELSAIWWNAAAQAPALPRGRRLDVVAEPRISSWSGQVELEIRDVRCGECG